MLVNSGENQQERYPDTSKAKIASPLLIELSTYVSLRKRAFSLVFPALFNLIIGWT